MGKSNKARERRNPEKGAVPSKPKSSRRLLSKPALVIGAIASVALALGMYMFPKGQDKPKAQPPPPPVKTEEHSTPKPQLTSEQQIAALKDEQARLAKMVMEDFPDTEGALELMGNLCSRHGRSEEAAEYWRRCLAIDPRRMSVYVSLGTVAIDAGRFEQAVEHLRKAIEINPHTPNVHEKLGQALFELGRYDEAIEQLEAELRIVPRSAVSNFLLAQASLKVKKYEKARLHYEKALQLSPDYANACYGLAQTYARMKQTDKAAEFQTKFRQLRDRQNKDAYEDRGTRPAVDLDSVRESTALALMNAEKLYRVRKDFRKSETLLKRAVQLDPGNPKYYEKLGSLYNMTGRLPEALIQMERMSKVDPANPFCYLNMGKLSIRLEQYEKAETAFRNAISVAPNLSVGYRELARFYLTSGANLPKALELAKKATDMEASAENFFVLSWAYDVNRDRPAALNAIKKAIRMDPKNRNYRQIHERIRTGK